MIELNNLGDVEVSGTETNAKHYKALTENKNKKYISGCGSLPRLALALIP